MSQSKAKPTRARPVVSDLILTVSAAVQAGKQTTAAGPCCPDHSASNSAPKTTIPACQLKPIWPPAMPPRGLLEPKALALPSSVAPSPDGVVVAPVNAPTKSVVDDPVAQPYPAFTPK